MRTDVRRVAAPRVRPPVCMQVPGPRRAVGGRGTHGSANGHGAGAARSGRTRPCRHVRRVRVCVFERAERASACRRGACWPGARRRVQRPVGRSVCRGDRRAAPLLQRRALCCREPALCAAAGELPGGKRRRLRRQDALRQRAELKVRPCAALLQGRRLRYDDGARLPGGQGYPALRLACL